MEQATEDKDVKEEQILQQKINRRNFISFGTFFATGTAIFGGWKWLYHSPKEVPTATAGAHAPLRRALNKSELFFKRFFSDGHLVRKYPKSMAAKKVRTNSYIGIADRNFDQSSWQLTVAKGTSNILKVNMSDIKALPKSEIIFDFKCVEGWDQIQHWAGVKFIDFINHYGLQDLTKMNYVGMETPDKAYFVGIDMESAIHPDTLLAYEMNDQPIAPEHGAPLRLIIPVKYGIKNLKRIGTITFSNQRPRDYWAEVGYDYYSGL